MRDETRRFDGWPSVIVFDLDGTLVDSSRDLTEALNKVAAIAGLAPFSVKEAIDFVGHGIAALVEGAFEARGRRLDVRELSAHVEQFRAAYSGHLTDFTKPYAGIPEVMARLASRGIPAGICTNKEEALAQSIVDGVGLGDYFRVVVGGLPGRPAKPSPEPLLETIARLGGRPEGAIMVGDSVTDMRCARNAAVRFIGVTFGYSQVPMSELGAEVTMESYSEFEAACRAAMGHA